MALRPFLNRLRALIGRRRREAELAEELQYHLEQDARVHRARGLAPDAARAAARRAFGNVPLVQEAARDSWRWRRLDDLRADLVFALRRFRREPSLVLAVLLTIGLGVGLNVAVFTLFNAYVLRPYPVRDPGSLYQVQWSGTDGARRGFSWARYSQLERHEGIHAGTAGWGTFIVRLDRQPAVGQAVTGSFFRMLGVGAALGRVLEPSDALAPGSLAVAVLGHHAWQTRFGGDPAVVGRALELRGVKLEIVGVAEAGFEGIGDVRPDVYVPVTMASVLAPGLDAFGPSEPELLNAVIRLPSGTMPASAEAGLFTWMRTITAQVDSADRVLAVELSSKATMNPLTPELLLAVTPLAMAFGLVLLAACANVASMMIARGVARRREIGIRLAIGADRRRIVRQLVTESLALAVPAGLVAFAFSRLFLSGTVAMVRATTPAYFEPYVRLSSLAPDLRVLAFAVLAAMGSALLFGLLPAMQSTRPGAVGAARLDDGGARPSRLRHVLVVGQVTVAALLLVVAGVLLRGAQRAQRVETGFALDGLVTVGVNDAVRARAVDRLRRTPVVRSIAATAPLPLEARSLPRIGVRAAGDSTGRVAARVFASAGFFETLGLDLVAGREFAEHESRAGFPVAVVNEAFARALWGGANPLARTFALQSDSVLRGQSAEPTRWVRVVGVARNAVTGWIGEAADVPTVYLPTAVDVPGTVLLLRVHGPAEPASEVVERELMSLDQTAVEELHTLADAHAAAVWPFRAAFWVAGAVGALALALTISGVYGVLAFVVATRTREIGVRLALGSTRGRVVRLVMTESAKLGAIGVGIGVLVALAVSRLAASRIVLIDVYEPIAYAGGVLAVLFACLAGASLPSYRASRVEPLDALRAE